MGRENLSRTLPEGDWVETCLRQLSRTLVIMPRRRLEPDEEIGNLVEGRRDSLSSRLVRQAGHQSGERRRLVLWITLVVRAALRSRLRFDTKLKERVEHLIPTLFGPVDLLVG